MHSISFNLPLIANNKLHSDVFLETVRVWLKENFAQDQYEYIERTVAAMETIVLPQHAMEPGALTMFGGPRLLVRISFVKEEDRNLFQLIIGPELVQNGAKAIKTGIKE